MVSFDDQTCSFGFLISYFENLWSLFWLPMTFDDFHRLGLNSYQFWEKIIRFEVKIISLILSETFSVENLETFSMENHVNWNQTNVKKIKWMEDICVSLKCKRLVELICWKYLCFFIHICSYIIKMWKKKKPCYSKCTSWKRKYLYLPWIELFVYCCYSQLCMYFVNWQSFHL